MLTFALDTATSSPSLALLRDDDPAAELWLSARPETGRRVLEAAHHLLGAAGAEVRDIERIVVGVGPGGFTGLRIGIATALGLGQALDAPVVGASSLEALALAVADRAGPGAVVCPALDARRGELFAALYRAGPAGGLEELMAPAALVPEDLAALVAERTAGEAVHVAGDGLGAHPVGLGRAPFAPEEGVGGPRAVDLARRVAAGAGRPARPVYARLPDAEVNRLRRARAAA